MNKSKVCQNCAYWGVYDNEEATGDHKDCDSEKFTGGYGGASKLDDDAVLVENDEGWKFVTGRNFGCVHWKRESSIKFNSGRI